jgi:hypothetical protein
MLASVRNDSADRIISSLVDELHEMEKRGDSASWDKATLYVAAFDQAKGEPKYKGLGGQKLTRAINNDIRADAAKRAKQIPRPSFLSNAKKVDEVWSDIFTAGSKDLKYETYMLIAVSSLERDKKNDLRDWLESKNPSREELRQRIREEVDARNGIYKPDFESKVTNFWKFNSHHPNGGYGGVHGLAVANLIYWFTEPGDIVIDPMAGTGVTGNVVGAYRFFREVYEAEGSGERTVHMADIEPQRDDIIRADAKAGLPFDKGVAQLAIVDPPYLRIADEKLYANLGITKDEWLASLQKIVRNVIRCMKPGGQIAVMTDDVLRQGEHVPIGYEITGMLAKLGLVPRTTIYNHNPNFIYTMGPAQMRAARIGKTHVNGCKIIQVATVPTEKRKIKEMLE